MMLWYACTLIKDYYYLNKNLSAIQHPWLFIMALFSLIVLLAMSILGYKLTTMRNIAGYRGMLCVAPTFHGMTIFLISLDLELDQISKILLIITVVDTFLHGIGMISLIRTGDALSIIGSCAFLIIAAWTVPTIQYFTSTVTPIIPWICWLLMVYLVVYAYKWITAGLEVVRQVEQNGPPPDGVLRPFMA